MNNQNLGSCGAWGREIVYFSLIKIEIIQEKKCTEEHVCEIELFILWKINWGMLKILRIYLSKNRFESGSAKWLGALHQEELGEILL